MSAAVCGAARARDSPSPPTREIGRSTCAGTSRAGRSRRGRRWVRARRCLRPHARRADSACGRGWLESPDACRTAREALRRIRARYTAQETWGLRRTRALAVSLLGEDVEAALDQD
eukprot:2134361-Prymnesium_polylepis.1